MAARDPSLRARQPWKAVTDKDYEWLGDVISRHYRGDDTDLKLIAAGLLQAYGDFTIEEFEAAVEVFFSTAEHPKLGRPYGGACSSRWSSSCVISGETASRATSSPAAAGIHARIAEPCYGIPPEHVIGSSVALKLRARATTVTLVSRGRAGHLQRRGDEAGRHLERLGRRPILAGGNSNGDIPMLRFAPSRRTRR